MKYLLTIASKSCGPPPCLMKRKMIMMHDDDHDEMKNHTSTRRTTGADLSPRSSTTSGVLSLKTSTTTTPKKKKKRINFYDSFSLFEKENNITGQRRKKERGDEENDELTTTRTAAAPPGVIMTSNAQKHHLQQKDERDQEQKQHREEEHHYKGDDHEHHRIDHKHQLLQSPLPTKYSQQQTSPPPLVYRNTCSIQEIPPRPEFLIPNLLVNHEAVGEAQDKIIGTVSDLGGSWCSWDDEVESCSDDFVLQRPARKEVSSHDYVFSLAPRTGTRMVPSYVHDDNEEREGEEHSSRKKAW